MVVDAGRVINPITASGQVEGGLQQVLGFAHCEEMVYDEQGRMVNARFGPYHTYQVQRDAQDGSHLCADGRAHGAFWSQISLRDRDGWHGPGHGRCDPRCDGRLGPAGALYARASVASAAGRD